MLVCPSCGSENEPDAAFCEACGSKLTAVCASCGSPLKPAARFCRKCGAPVAGAAGAQPGPVAALAAPIVGHAAERRLVSVLFTDLVGFTALAEGRDPEETRELLSRYFDLARETVERYAGTIEKFIGDAVMAVWGAPTAREDDAERAVRAGLELVSAVRDLGPGLQARAGVLTGEAAVTIGATGQGMVAGDLVNTASRLQSAAVPGTVLVGEATRRAASGAIAFESAGEATLKGKAAPVPAFRALRVVAERGGRGRSEAVEAPFVGRDDELRLLKDLFHATSREHRARLVSVLGPSGIGKTRLAWEFLKYIDGLAEDVWWHEGRSPSYGEGVSFWALGEMVRRRCGLAETDDEATTRARVAATLAEHVRDEAERRWVEGALLELLGVGEGRVATAELLGAWRTFFERLSESGVVALVFEDFNNADDGLIDFVDSLLEWSRTKPIFVLTLARPDLLERRPDWHAKRNFNAVTLEPLPDGAMHELLAGLVPGLPEAAIGSIVARADGIPLYAVETVRMLLAQGRLAVRDGVYTPAGDLGDLAVPDTLTALISSRLDALEPAERSLVHDAAVLGQSFTLAGLAAVSGMPDAELAARLRTLVRREVLAVSADPRSPDRGQYAFVQALLREVAYNTLSHADRRSRHLAAAAYFESLDNDELAGAVAGQYLAAWQNASGAEADVLATTARRALGTAIARATSLGSYAQAAVLCDEALALATGLADRADLLEQAADALSQADKADASIDRAREAVALRGELGDRLKLAAAITLLGRTLGAARRGAEALDVLLPAVDEFADLEGTPAAVALLLAAASAFGIAEQYDRQLEFSDRALAVAERLDLGPDIAALMVTRGTALTALGQVNQGMALIRGAIEVAEERGLTAEVSHGRGMLALVMNHRDLDQAMELNRVALAEGRRLGNVPRAVVAMANAAESARATGDWDWAIREITNVLDLDLGATDRMMMVVAITVLRAWRGEDVTVLVDESGALFGSSDARVSAEVCRADMEASIALASGDLPSAVDGARRYARLSPLSAPDALATAGRAGAWLRDRASVADDLVAHESTGVQGAIRSLERTVMRAAIDALDGRSDEARARFVTARQGLADRGARFEAALVAIDMATLLGPGDPAVLAAATDARAFMEQLGAVPFLARLDAELSAPRP